MLTSPCIVLKALAGLVQEFGRQGEVTLGGSDVDMAEVSGQLRQQALHIRPMVIPGDQEVYGGGVPQVMQSRLFWDAVVTHPAGTNSKSAEHMLLRVARHRGGSEWYERR